MSHVDFRKRTRRPDKFKGLKPPCRGHAPHCARTHTGIGNKMKAYLFLDIGVIPSYSSKGKLGEYVGQPSLVNTHW